MESTARFTFYGSKLDGSARQPGLCGQLLERGRDPVRAPTLDQAGCVGTRDENEVVPMRKRVVQRPERLSQCPLHCISLYGAADLAAHRDAEADLILIVVGLAARERIDDQEAVGVGAALAIYAVEVAAPRQATTPAPLAGGHGVSRLRPLRRRRLMICRPLRVRMRARNPCVRARLRFLGW